MVRWFTFSIALAALAATPLPCSAQIKCAFGCGLRRAPTLGEQLADAKLVLYGMVSSAGVNPAGGGTSAFHVLSVLREHPARLGSTWLHVDFLLDVPNSKNLPQWIVFCDVENGRVKVTGGTVVESEAMVHYVAGILDVHEKSPPEQLRFFFDHLENKDAAVGGDALLAIQRFKVDKASARDLPAETLAKRLTDPATSPYLVGEYARLLGYCGDAKKHGDLLRSLLDDPKKRLSGNIDGLLTGYALLQPKQALGFVQELFKDHKQNFTIHYYAFDALRSVAEAQPDLFTKEEMAQTMRLALALPEMADFAIDDLRQRQAWTFTDDILDLFAKETHNSRVVRRAILRFALCSPNPRAAEFVLAQRLRDPQWVKDTEELLELFNAELAAPKKE